MVDKERFEKIKEKNKIKLNKFINDIYLDDQKNQILKAEEKNIYLFLDETFSKEELRNMRLFLINNLNIDEFIRKFSIKKENNKIYKYKYNIEYTTEPKLISVEIKEKIENYWMPSSSFLYEIEKIKANKKMLFKKLVSNIYKENYPITSPSEANMLFETNKIYFKKLIKHYILNIDKTIRTIDIKYYTYMSLHDETKLFELKDTKCRLLNIYSAIDNANELLEEEILILNKILEISKYKIFINKYAKSNKKKILEE